jgi:hypothetical protein
MKDLSLSICITVVVVTTLAVGISQWMFVSCVNNKAEMFVDRLSDHISDEESVEEIKAEMERYYNPLPTWAQDQFNKHMQEYIEGQPNCNPLQKAKTVKDIINGIETYYKDAVSDKDKPAFIAELENLIVILPSEEGKKATSENEKIKEVIQNYNVDLGTDDDKKEFVEKLGALVVTLTDQSAGNAAQEQKDDITSFLNGLAYGDLTEEEEAIFNQKLGEYVQGIKAGKQDEVKMEGNFAQIVEFYNNLTPENQKVFVEVVEEYIKQ